MLRLALRSAAAHAGRLLLTAVAVLLGVTFVTGSLILTDTSQQVLDDQFATATSGADLAVRRAVSFDAAMGVEVTRDPVPADVLQKVRATTGVQRAEPVARGQGLLVVDGSAVIPKGPSLLESWLPEDLGPYRLRGGRPPVGSSEVVLDVATARSRGIRIGDTVTVQTRSDTTLRVVGLAGFGDTDGPPSSTLALVDLRTARKLLGLGTGASEISVVAADGIAVDTVRDRLAAALGGGYQVTSSQDLAARSADAAKTQVGYLRLLLLAMAAAALLVGGFLVANTFAMVVAGRTRELALLRAAGATGRQVLRSVLVEAALVGLLASVAGAFLGIGAASGLRRLVAAFGVSLPAGPLVVAAPTLVGAVVAGTVITVLAAAAPARRASRVSPLQALRAESAVVSTGRVRSVLGLALIGLGAAAVVGTAVGGGPVAGVGAGSLLLLAGITLTGPLAVGPAVRALGRALAAPFGRRAGMPSRLAREFAARAPRRTSATTTALAIGLALISFMAVLAGSVKQSVAAGYRETITADLVVESARNEMLGGLPATLAEHVGRLPEVAVVSRMRFGHWKDGTATSALTAIDPATLPEVANVRLEAGSLEALERGGVILAREQARQRGLGVGDVLPMTFARTGTVRVPVVGILPDATAQGLSTGYLLSLDTYRRYYAEDVDASVLVRLADGARPERGRAAIAAALRDYPTADLRDQAEAVQGRLQAIDQVLGLVTVLLLLTIIIALLGMASTMALSTMERTREIGLLRAVGMTRGQLRSMIRGEALLMAVLAALVGTALGVGTAAAVVGVLAATSTMTVVLPLAPLAGVIALAVVTGLIASALPARRAARLDVLGAIAAQ